MAAVLMLSDAMHAVLMLLGARGNPKRRSISVWLTQDEVEEVEAKLEASEQQPRTKLQRVLTRLCTPVFLEALILTFLAGQ